MLCAANKILNRYYRNTLTFIPTPFTSGTSLFYNRAHFMNLLCGLGNSAVTESQHHVFYKHFVYPKRTFVKKTKEYFICLRYYLLSGNYKNISTYTSTSKTDVLLHFI